jgi:hypothetical protein
LLCAWLGVVRVGHSLILVVVVGYDVMQRRHAVLHNFPVIGHLRYLLESVGPELRQYIVTDNRQERPFDRDQRQWIYTSAKGLNNNFGFGSDEDQEATPGQIIIDQSMCPLPRPGPAGRCGRLRQGGWLGPAAAGHDPPGVGGSTSPP